MLSTGLAVELVLKSQLFCLVGTYYHFCILQVFLGSRSFETENLVEVTDLHFEKIYATHWEEHIYVSDHSDAPKVSKI